MRNSKILLCVFCILTLCLFTFCLAEESMNDTSSQELAEDVLQESLVEEYTVPEAPEEEPPATEGLEESHEPERQEEEPAEPLPGADYIITLTKRGQRVNTTLSIYETARIEAELPEGVALIAKSAKPSIASVDDHAIITALQEGKAKITVSTSTGLTATVNVTVIDPLKPVKVSFQETKRTLNLGEALALSPALSPDTAVTAYTWKSSNTKVLTVSDDGVVTPFKEGSARVTVTTANKLSAYVTITVVDPYKPTKISFAETRRTLNLGETLALSPTLTPDTAVTAYTWKSSNTKVLTVSDDGVVTPLKEGSARVTVTTANKLSAYVSVTVVDPYKPTKVSFAEAKQTLNLGETLALSPTLTPDTAVTAYAWKSSNTRVLAVSADGVVTPLKEGTARVTVTTANRLRATISITVMDPYKPTGIRLPASATIGLDETLPLTAQLSPDNAVTTITWKSGRTSVARVDANGLVTPIKVGSAVITATTANGLKATTTITVVATRKPESVTISGSSRPLLIPLEGTAQLNAALSPKYAVSGLTWESSDESIITVSDSGLVAGISTGTAIITARTETGKFAKREVQVVPADSEELLYPLKSVVIGIDPGHQARQDTSKEPVAPGSSTTKAKVSSGCAGVKSCVNEYEINLQVGLKLRDALAKLGCTVVMTREVNDINISNRQRAELMNEAGCDLAIRLHCNSGKSSKQGISTYASKSYGDVDGSRKAAEILLQALTEATGARNDGMYINNVYTGNNWATVPCVMVEMGYLSNAHEDELLISNTYQDLLVEGMVEAIFDFVGK